ncbi:MAG: addiction module protein [candidate division KSB1 bacterium]|nr:addiction module protein [candidate division KSB1 bacterium]
MKTDEILSTVDYLPIDIKLQLVDRLLSSINPSQKEINELWAIEAEKRVEEIKAGKVKLIDGEEVFKEIRERVSR